MARLARPLAALSRTSTIFTTPAVQARQLTIHAGASVAVGAQRIRYQLRVFLHAFFSDPLQPQAKGP